MKTLLGGLLFFFILTLPVSGNSSSGFVDFQIEKKIESQITPKSSSTKIKKLQTLFKELGLYSGNIDGKYSSIKTPLINYQIKSGLINSESDWGAGYFGKKTILLLKKEYKSKFEESAKKNLYMIEPKKGETSFVVTAYYSPLPGQKKYTTGSYHGDIKLNGGGKVTASGKKVFSGLLAAPRNYQFGTKIFLEGIGIGSVEDRGGAIVNAGDRGHAYDRIDIWMGYGDEGLARALKWGKREVKGDIISEDIFVNIKFQNSPTYNYNNLLINSISNEGDIKKLQELFTNIEVYSGSIDGKYSSVKNALLTFQLDNNIIKTKTSDEAGYFGPKGLAAIRQKYTKNIFVYKESKYGKINTFGLSLKQRVSLEKIKRRINKYFDKKTSNDKIKKDIYISKLKIKLTALISRQKDILKKQQLEYLNEII